MLDYAKTIGVGNWHDQTYHVSILILRKHLFSIKKEKHFPFFLPMRAYNFYNSHGISLKIFIHLHHTVPWWGRKWPRDRDSCTWYKRRAVEAMNSRVWSERSQSRRTRRTIPCNPRDRRTLPGTRHSFRSNLKLPSPSQKNPGWN
jgi:hypothetical protein